MTRAPRRRRSMSREPRKLERAARAIALGLALCACQPAAPEEPARVRISVDPAAAQGVGAGAVAATLWENGDARAVRLGPLRRTDPVAPWRERALRDEAAGAPAGRLIFDVGAAALVYHLASRTDGLPSEATLPNRLVVFESDGATELALWIEAPGHGAERAWADLAPEPAARLLALAQALGAVAPLRADRFPAGPDGSPRLPFFVPESFGDWRILRERSLESLLPAAYAARLAASSDLRALRDRFLASDAAALPGLAAAVQREAAALAISGIEAERAAVQSLLVENGAALRGYLDSAWIELLVSERRPDTARISLYVDSVTDVEIPAFEAIVPHRRLVSLSAALAGLRLAPADASAPIGIHLGQDRVEFRTGTTVSPRPHGPWGFEGTVLEYRLTGLAALGEERTAFLDALEVRAQNRALESPIPADHIQRVSSLEDPRYAVGPEPGIDEFMRSLPGILESEDGGSGVRVDREARRLVWSAGSYRLLDDFVPPAGYAVVFEAGVDVAVAPARSLLVRAPLTVRGTAAHPVRVRAASPAEPWGVLAVQGRGRSSLDLDRSHCEIRYLEVSGGSEDYLRGVFYSGQLSVYHADLRMDHTTASGATADDAVNVKYAAVEIVDSSFTDNAADAVDLDWVEGAVRRSFFGRGGPGGDGIDVSGSEVEVEDSVFSEIQDKCLSVGEDSRLVLRGSLLRRCTLGVASKDRSLVDVRESVFLDNGRHLSAFEKKPIFGPARIRAANLRIGGADEADAHDAASVIEVEAAGPLPADAVEALRTADGFSRDRYAELADRMP